MSDKANVFSLNSAVEAAESIAKYHMETLNLEDNLLRREVMDDIRNGEVWEYSPGLPDGSKGNNVLQWFGGKKHYVNFILPYLPYTQRYVEPFGGSGAVLLNRNPTAQEIYSDVYWPVVNFYQVVQDPQKQEQLFERMQMRSGPFLKNPRLYIGYLYVYSHYTVQTLGKQRTWEDVWKEAHTYYQRLFLPPEVYSESIIRDYLESRDQNLPPDIRLAEATYWFNRLSFQGIMHRERPNSLAKSALLKAHEDIQEQRERIIRFYASTGANLALATSRLLCVEIRNERAQELIQEFNDSDTLFYLDPPYLKDTRTQGIEYGDAEMLTADHIELGALVNASKAKIAISGYDHALYNTHLFPEPKWRRVVNPVNTGKRQEVLWMNY